MCMDSLHALIATTRAPPQGKGSKDNPVHNSSRIVPTAKMLLERLANNVRNVGLSMRSDCSTVSSEYPDFDQKVGRLESITHILLIFHLLKSATSSCIRTYTSLCKPNTECSLPAKSSNKWEVIRGQYSKSNYISNLVEIRSILREAKTSGIIPELLVHESVNLPKYMGGEQGFFYEKSFVFAVVKRAVLSRDHWADIHSFVGSGTFGYVLLARKSSFQGNDPQSPKQIVLKIDHKKQFVVWEVFIHAKVRQPTLSHIKTIFFHSSTNSWSPAWTLLRAPRISIVSAWCSQQL